MFELNQNFRQICYVNLTGKGYCDLQLFAERKISHTYWSYWAAGHRRLEVLYNIQTDTIQVYELAFVEPQAS